MTQPAAPDEVLLHPDALRLERELGDRIEALTGDERFSVPRILVLAPSQRQVQRVRQVLAARFPALLGVEVVTYLALARRVAESATEDTPQIMDRPLREAVVETLLGANPDHPLSAYAREFPVVIPSLTGLLGELREAGVTPTELERDAAGRREKDLARLLGEYGEALSFLESNPATPPRTDRAGLTARATKLLAHHPAYDAVIAYGAYDLVGMNLELIQAIPCRGARVWLIPADLDAPSWEFAREFIRRNLSATPSRLEDDGDARPFVRAGRAFRDRDVPGGFLEPHHVELVHTQGPEAELTHVARAVLRDLADGVDPTDIGIVARTLEPYSSVMESVFDQHGIPIDAATGFSAARDPGILAVLTLLRTLVDNFSRQPVMDLLRSPVFRRGDTEAWSPNLWDRLSRVYGISQGIEGWTQTLPELVAAQELRADDPDEDALQRFQENKNRQMASVTTLAGVLTGLSQRREVWTTRKSGSEHEAFVRELITDTLSLRKDQDAHAALEAALTALGSLDEALEATAHVTGRATRAALTPGAVLEFLERTLTDTQLPWSTPGGVMFLDVMQARGLMFRKLYLVGFNADLVPRRPRENVFLSDATRRRLVERGRPIHVSTDTAAEEHLLLAQTAVSVVDQLTLSWQRADAEGKSMAVSLSLQEWSRVMDGALPLRDRLDATHDQGGPWRLPTHPADAVRALIGRNNLASPLDGALLLAHGAGHQGPQAVGRFIDRLPFLDLEPMQPGLTHIAAVDRFTDGDGAYDGLVPDHAWDGVFSPSGLETLAGCPLRFYFQKVLRIRPLEEVPDAHEIDPMDMGTRIHRILELVYQPLQDQDPASTPLDTMIDTALGHLESAWDETLDPVRRRMSARFPALWEATATFWRGELEAFIRRDLTRLHQQGWIIDSVEPPRDAEFQVTPHPESTRIQLAGRLDRLCRGPDRYLVTDYKTGGNLDTWIAMGKLLPGTKLQLPLYTRMLEARYPDAVVTAELLGLGPSFLPDSGFVRKDAVVLPDLNPEQTEGLWETVDLLVRQTRSGSYPLHKDGPCDYCEFRDACRRRHVPSVERLSEIPQNLDYLHSRRKSTTRPTLAKVREADQPKTAPEGQS